MQTALVEQDHKKPVFVPNPGGQWEVLSCPIYEILIDGDRGGGKTDALLWKYGKYVGKGFGPYWRGIIFARKYKQLEEVVTRSKQWFRQAFPSAKWLAAKSDYKWVWPSGEELLLRILESEDQYWDYHGAQYPFIGFEELTRWPDDGCYNVMKSCSRSTYPGMPRFYVSNTNPYGAGFQWVKNYFIIPMPRSTVMIDQYGEPRVAINCPRRENVLLNLVDPRYEAKLSADSNKERKKAWLKGSWDISVGGYFEDAWDEERNLLNPFTPPVSWPRFRAMDWGYAKPFSVGWYCVDYDGCITRYRELYGYGGKPNVGTRERASIVAQKIIDAEAQERKSGVKFKRSPADSAIWAQQGTEKAIVDYFDAARVYFIPSQKGPGSRVRGWQLMAEAMKAGLFKVTKNCRHWLRTVPYLMPDEDDLEDIDTEQEDHAADESRYAVVSRQSLPRMPKTRQKPKDGHTFDDITQETETFSRRRRR